MSVVRPAAVAIVIGNLVNVVGNWVLIFGHLGVPGPGGRRLGVLDLARPLGDVLLLVWASRRTLARYWRGFTGEALALRAPPPAAADRRADRRCTTSVELAVFVDAWRC